RPDIALWELILLDVVMILMILAYGRTSPFAAALLLPYLAWLLLATAINFWIVQHNTIGGESSTTMTNQQVEHDVFMREAIEIAKENQAAPFGAVLVHRGRQEVSARGVNQAQRSPTLHGEIAAIQRYAELGGDQWNELTLYTTAEPCCMCQGAILWANIAEVVFGISIPELAQLGWKQIDISCSEVVARSWRPDASITGGVLLSECRELFRHATPWK
ncbi:MAG: nucleoside deaminase, partial [Planctomycetota bacterium]